MIAKVSMDKEYCTLGGGQVRVLCIDRDDPEYPVVALVRPPESLVEDIKMYTAEGYYYEADATCPHDLVEVSPYSDLPIDTTVDLHRPDGSYLGRYHFAGLRKPDNTLLVWCEGRTSHTKRDAHDTMVVLPGFRFEVVQRKE